MDGAGLALSELRRSDLRIEGSCGHLSTQRLRARLLYNKRAARTPGGLGRLPSPALPDTLPDWGGIPHRRDAHHWGCRGARCRAVLLWLVALEISTSPTLLTLPWKWDVQGPRHSYLAP